jgi:hypothetical protein
MFFGGAWGYLQLLKLPVPPGRTGALPAGGGSLLSDRTALLALAVLAVTAVLAGLLAFLPRISPLASGLPGLLFLAWTALYLVNVRQAVHLIPLRSQAFGSGWEGLLFNGILGAVGAVMVFPLFVPSRWRLSRRAQAAPCAPDVPEDLADVTTGSGLPQRKARQRADQPLVGTVISRPSGAMPTDGMPAAAAPAPAPAAATPAAAAPAGTVPVDTTRVTGASRALRNTGSFRMAAGSQPRATGSMPSMPRARGAYRRPADSRLRGGPREE